VDTEEGEMTNAILSAPRQALVVWPVLLFCWGGTVEAQERRAETFPPLGTEVRAWVQTPDDERKLRGVLSSHSPFEMVLQSAAGEEYVVPVADLSRLDRNAGRSHGMGAVKGLGLGLGIGFVAGGILGAATHDSSKSPCDSPGCTDSAGGAFLLNGIVVGVFGAPIGGLIGGIRGSQRWERVW